MAEPTTLLEIYQVADFRAQERIVRRLRRKAFLRAEAASDEGRELVVVNSSQPSRAHWVFKKVRTIDPDAVLIHAASDETTT